jgi:hypothetical protein
MSTLANTCEGTNSVAISTTNSAGPNQLDAITLSGTGTTATWDNTQAHAGATSAKLHMAAVASTDLVQWLASITATANGYSRFYIYMTARPTVNTQLARMLTAAGGTCASLRLNTTGTLTTVNSAGTTIAATTGTIPLNAWCRVEFEVIGISGTTGTVNARIYSGANLASIFHRDASGRCDGLRITVWD